MLNLDETERALRTRIVRSTVKGSTCECDVCCTVSRCLAGSLNCQHIGATYAKSNEPIYCDNALSLRAPGCNAKDGKGRDEPG